MMHLFAPLGEIIIAIVVGFLFGFALQKGRVARFDVIVGQLLLKDFTMLKVMLTAIIVGGIGVYSLMALSVGQGVIAGQFSVVAVTLGAAILAIGMAILGYCPGTAVAAAGQGAHDALFGILGLTIGVWGYGLAYPLIARTILNKGIYPAGTTLATITGVQPWLIFVLLVGIALALFPLLTRFERRSQQ